MLGTVKTIKDRRFGFTTPDDGGKDVFFHVSDLAPDLPRDATLQERRVVFDLEKNDRGPYAANVRPA